MNYHVQFIFQPNFQSKFKTTVHLNLPVQKVIDMPERPRKGKPTKTIVCKPALLPPPTHFSCHRNICVCLSAITKTLESSYQRTHWYHDLSSFPRLFASSECHGTFEAYSGWSTIVKWQARGQKRKTVLWLGDQTQECVSLRFSSCTLKF